MWTLTATAALAAALDALLPDGPARQGIDLLLGLTMAFSIAALLPQISG